MPTQTDTDAVLLTPAAVEAVRNLLAERNAEGYGLRVYVAGQGCSGLQYGMGLDDKPAETDLTFETDGIKVHVDDQSILFMRGSTIDYIDDERGKGFLVNNPNQISGCSSCGSSGECH